MLPDQVAIALIIRMHGNGDIAGAQRMLAKLDATCSYGCAQADELRRWIATATPDAS